MRAERAADLMGSGIGASNKKSINESTEAANMLFEHATW